VYRSTTFENLLAKAWSPFDWGEVTVVLSVSGGADSVALLRAMAALVPSNSVGRLVVAHLNHQLRGDDSANDERFVRDLAETLGLSFDVERADHARLEAVGQDGLEAAARQARYDFLRRTAERWGARYVATGHTADDQAETILHRIVRGTGITGLSGMARARTLSPATTLIRPLLTFRRAEIVAYLDELGQGYRTDASNTDTRFTRNRIRHDLLPRLTQEYNPSVVDALLRLGSLARESQGVVDRLVDDLRSRCVTRPCDSPVSVAVDTSQLRDQPRYVVRELLLAVWRDEKWPMQAMGFTQWESLAALLLGDADMGDEPPTRKKVFPGGIVAERHGDRFMLIPPKE